MIPTEHLFWGWLEASKIAMACHGTSEAGSAAWLSRFLAKRFDDMFGFSMVDVSPQIPTTVEISRAKIWNYPNTSRTC